MIQQVPRRDAAHFVQEWTKWKPAWLSQDVAHSGHSKVALEFSDVASIPRSEVYPDSLAETPPRECSTHDSLHCSGGVPCCWACDRAVVGRRWRGSDLESASRTRTSAVFCAACRRRERVLSSPAESRSPSVSPRTTFQRFGRHWWSSGSGMTPCSGTGSTGGCGVRRELGVRQAVVWVIADAYPAGVSTRRWTSARQFGVERVAERGLAPVSLVAIVADFHTRPLDGAATAFLALDALTPGAARAAELTESRASAPAGARLTYAAPEKPKPPSGRTAARLFSRRGERLLLLLDGRLRMSLAVMRRDVPSRHGGSIPTLTRGRALLRHGNHLLSRHRMSFTGYT